MYIIYRYVRPQALHKKPFNVLFVYTCSKGQVNIACNAGYRTAHGKEKYDKVKNTYFKAILLI